MNWYVSGKGIITIIIIIVIIKLDSCLFCLCLCELVFVLDVQVLLWRPILPLGIQGGQIKKLGNQKLWRVQI